MKLKNSLPFPTTYNICTTCGFDHVNDLPHLSEETIIEARQLHLQKHSHIPSDIPKPTTPT